MVVDLACADGFTDSRVTDANGNYLFTNVPAGVCDVTVDVGTAPAGKVPGNCPTTFSVDLAAGASFLDADFCFVSPPAKVGDTVFCDPRRRRRPGSRRAGHRGA